MGSGVVGEGQFNDTDYHTAKKAAPDGSDERPPEGRSVRAATGANSGQLRSAGVRPRAIVVEP